MQHLLKISFQPSKPQWTCLYMGSTMKESPDCTLEFNMSNYWYVIEWKTPHTSNPSFNETFMYTCGVQKAGKCHILHHKSVDATWCIVMTVTVAVICQIRQHLFSVFWNLYTALKKCIFVMISVLYLKRLFIGCKCIGCWLTSLGNISAVIDSGV